MHMSEDEIWQHHKPYLGQINSQFSSDWVLDRYLFKAPNAQPVFTVGAGKRIPSHSTPIQGLYLANMSQIYPEDRGQNHSIELADKVANIVHQNFNPVKK